MKIRFIIKEQVAQSTEDLQNKLNDAMTAAIQNLDTVPDPVVAQNLINQALQLLNQAAGTAPQTTPSPTLGEKKEKFTKKDIKKRDDIAKSISTKALEKRYGVGKDEAENIKYAIAADTVKKSKKKKK